MWQMFIQNLNSRYSPYKDNSDEITVIVKLEANIAELTIYKCFHELPPSFLLSVKRGCVIFLGKEIIYQNVRKKTSCHFW
jgi:hypothetical protein